MIRLINHYRKKLKKLVTAQDTHCFWVHQGSVLKDLNELREALLKISDNQFQHHVNENKNDFAKWVEEILHDEKCGLALKKVRTKKEALHVVEKCLREYKI